MEARLARRDRLVAFLVAALTFLVFLPSLKGQFLNWDDNVNFTDNPFYRGLGLSQLKWMFTTVRMGHYQPLSWLTLGLDFELWGMNPAGYHLTSVLFHAANAVLLYFIARRILGETWSAAFAALFFAIHPLRVESVAWITERRDVVSGFFFLCCVALYLPAVRCEREALRYRILMAAALAAYGASLLSKAVALGMPVVLLSLDNWPLRRLDRRAVREKIPFVAVALLGAAAAFWAQDRTWLSLQSYGAADRLAQSFFAFAFYPFKTFIPIGLSPLYAPPSPTAVVAAVLFDLILMAGIIAARKKWPAGLSALIAYAATAAPVLGLTHSIPAADRYSYLSCLGWSLLLAGGLRSALKSSQARTLRACAAAFFLVLGFLTWRQTLIWRDSKSLWTFALGRDPSSLPAQINLAAVLLDEGKPEEAIALYDAAQRLDPGFPQIYFGRGRAFLLKGDKKKAAADFDTTLSLDARYLPEVRAIMDGAWRP